MIRASTVLDRYFCACCSARLDETEEHCSNCQAPLSLSQSVTNQAEDSRFISVLGASNAGKTVYLGVLLDILSKTSSAFHGTPASPFSVELQEYVVNELEKRSFPEKTPAEADAWQWVHCKLTMEAKKGTKTADLVSPDLAGEAIATEISQPGIYPAIENVVLKSSGILLLCDSVRVRDEGTSEDLFAVKLATYIAELHALIKAATETKKKKKKTPNGPAVAVVFTKCDACEEAAADPKEFAVNNTSRLYDFCEQTFDRVQYFAAGVAGSTGMITDEQAWQMRIPFHVQPFGILEPLQWIMSDPT